MNSKATMALDPEENDTKEPQNETVCICTHATHFLGRCQAAVEPPEQMCVDCMRNHFHRADDPAI